MKTGPILRDCLVQSKKEQNMESRCACFLNSVDVDNFSGRQHTSARDHVKSSLNVSFAELEHHNLLFTIGPILKLFTKCFVAL